MTTYGKTFHPGDQHRKYGEGAVSFGEARIFPGANEPPQGLSTIPVKELARLRAQAGKSARRRKANRDQHQAYIRLKAENASLRERLDKAVNRMVALELKDAINQTV